MNISNFLRKEKIISLNSMQELMLALKASNQKINFPCCLNPHASEYNLHSGDISDSLYVYSLGKVTRLTLAKDQVVEERQFDISPYDCKYIQEVEVEGIRYLAVNTENRRTSSQLHIHLEIFNLEDVSERKSIEIVRKRPDNFSGRVSKINQMGFIDISNPTLIIAHSNMGIIKISLEELLREERLKIDVEEKDNKDRKYLHLILPAEKVPLRAVMRPDKIYCSLGTKIYSWSAEQGLSEQYVTMNLVTCLHLSDNSLYWGDDQGKIFRNGEFVSRDQNSNPILQLEAVKKGADELILYRPYLRHSKGSFLYRCRGRKSEPHVEEKIQNFRIIKDSLFYQTDKAVIASGLSGEEKKTIYYDKSGITSPFNVGGNVK